MFVDSVVGTDSIDEDGDGEITDMELRVHLREFSKFTDKAITRLFTFLDIDSDGGITRDELRSAFVSYSALRQAIGSGRTTSKALSYLATDSIWLSSVSESRQPLLAVRSPTPSVFDEGTTWLGTTLERKQITPPVAAVDWRTVPAPPCCALRGA